MIINILNDKVVWKFLLLISYSPGRGYKYNEIKESLKLNNSSLYKVLHKLEFYNLIKKENNIIKLDFTNPNTQFLLEIIEKDKKKFNNLTFKAILVITDFLSMIDKNTTIKEVIIFGSYAKRTNKEESDIDIAIISKEKIDLFEYSYKIEEEYKIKLEIHNFTEKEFKNNNSKLIEEIKRDGIYLLK